MVVATAARLSIMKAIPVSFTYDDSMVGHLDSAMPHLEQFNLRGTFYVDAAPRHSFLDRGVEWAKAAARGHEIGNHTRLHPCRRSGAANLCEYSHQQICDEIAGFDVEIERIVGKQQHSFAYPCCHTTVGPDDKQVSYIDFVERLFPAARGGGHRADHPSTVNLMNVCSYVVKEGVTLSDVTRFVDDCIEKGNWCVFMFHGIGEGWLVTDLPTHLGICQHVAKRIGEGKVRNRTFVEAAMEIRAETNRPWQRQI